MLNAGQIHLIVNVLRLESTYPELGAVDFDIATPTDSSSKPTIEKREVYRDGRELFQISATAARVPLP